MEEFSIRAGNSSDIDQQLQCAFQHENVSRNGSVTLNCQAIARYVSFKREGGFEPQLVTICEFVVIGHPVRTEGVFYTSHCPV